MLQFFVGLGTALAHAQGNAAISTTTSTKDQAPFRVLAPLSEEDEEWIRKAPLKTKVGQLFIFGFMGHDLQKGLRKTLQRQQPGAVIIFGRNIQSATQIIEMNHEAQKQSLAKTGLPLLIAVDQEGGNVIRIRTSPPLPSALALGETGNPELVYSAGFHTGRLLKSLGFNMNLAPVLDVADPSTDKFVGTRTFGKSPELVAQMGTKFAQGLMEAAILPTAKHFPGHGGVPDSHKETPVKETTAEVIRKTDLVPFNISLREVPGAAVMLAHIAYPKLDSASLPATFSKPIITDLLRGSMEFNGLILTDDIEMAGTFVIKDPAERAVRAIEAGVDIVMIAWNKKLQSRAVAAVEAAVRSGRISETRLNESLRRIIRAKRYVSPWTLPEKPNLTEMQNIMKSQDLQNLTFETLNRQFESSFMRLAKKELIQDLSRPIFVFAATERFFSSFKGTLKGRTTRFYRLTSQKTFDINRVMRSNPDAIGVLHISGSQSARFANRLDSDNAARTILVNSETVSILKSPSEFHHIVDVNFRHPDLGRYTAKYIFGPPIAKQTQHVHQYATSSNNHPKSGPATDHPETERDPTSAIDEVTKSSPVVPTPMKSETDEVSR